MRWIKAFLLGKGGLALSYLLGLLAVALVLFIAYSEGARKGEKDAEKRLLPRIEELVGNAARCDMRATQLAVSLQNQNDALVSLEREAKEKEEKARKEVERARREARMYEDNARWFAEMRGKEIPSDVSCDEGLRIVRLRFAQ